MSPLLAILGLGSGELVGGFLGGAFGAGCGRPGLADSLFGFTGRGAGCGDRSFRFLEAQGSRAGLALGARLFRRGVFRGARLLNGRAPRRFDRRRGGSGAGARRSTRGAPGRLHNGSETAEAHRGAQRTAQPPGAQLARDFLVE